MDNKHDKEYEKEDKWDTKYQKHYMVGDDYGYHDDSHDGYHEDDYGATHKFTNYEELLLLTKQEDTEDKLKNIVFALIKSVIILNCEEVSFKFDLNLGSYNSWVEISTYFNSNHVGTDYRILIDEDAIVCKLLNETLITQ